jgi:hypothetical protein
MTCSDVQSMTEHDFKALVQAWNSFARHYDWSAPETIEPEIQDGSREAQCMLAADIFVAWGQKAVEAAQSIATCSGYISTTVPKKGRTHSPLDVSPAVSTGGGLQQRTLVFRCETQKNV